MDPTKERGWWIIKVVIFVAELYERVNPQMNVFIDIELKPELRANVTDIFSRKGGE